MPEKNLSLQIRYRGAVAQQEASFFGESHSRAGTREERGAEGLFEGLDPLGGSGLRNAEFSCRGRKVQEFGDSHKGGKLRVCDHHDLSWLYDKHEFSKIWRRPKYL
jgi:hypothetical protein